DRVRRVRPRHAASLVSSSLFDRNGRAPGRPRRTARLVPPKVPNRGAAAVRSGWGPRDRRGPGEKSAVWGILGGPRPLHKAWVGAVASVPRAPTTAFAEYRARTPPRWWPR